MKLIGITGGIGSGKTTVSGMFARLGAEVIDADEISRAVTKKGGAAYPELKEAFGKEILLPSGEIDRKALAKIVFSDKERLKRLNEITHRHIFIEMQKRMEASKAQVVVMDVPLLFSSEFPFKCDLTVGVTAALEERIKRVESRDGMARDEVLRRIENQISDEELKKKADVIIENNVIDSAFEQVRNIFNRIGIE